MASPQPDKFTKLSTELLEAFCRLQLSGSEWSFVHALIRKTYGFNKKEDWITNTQIMALTGLGKERVSEAKRSLLAKGIVTEKRNKIGLQKDYDRWKELRKNVTKVTEKRNSELRKNVTTIDNTIEDNSVFQTGRKITKKKDMSWNKYSEDYEEGVVDLESGEIHDPLAEQKEKDKELNQKFRASVDWLITHQGRDHKRTGIPKQLKAIQKLYTMGVSAAEAKRIIIECEGTDIWRGKLEKPDFWTVVSIIQKRG